MFANLGSLYYRFGNLPRAISIYEECLQKRRTLLGDFHKDTMTNISNLAVMHVKHGNYSTAEVLLEECLCNQRKALEEGDPHVTCSNLANCLAFRGYYDKSLILYQEIYSKRRKLLGDLNPKTLLVMNNVASLYSKIGDDAKAEELYEDCVAKRIQSLSGGRKHIDTIRSLIGLASVFSNTNQFDKALPLYEESYWAFVDTHGMKHPETLRIRSAFAAALSKSGINLARVE